MRIFLHSLITFGILLQSCFGQEEQTPSVTIEMLREKLTPTSHELLPSLFQLANSPGLAAQLAPELRALLSNENENVQLLAVRTLREAGPDASPAVDSLIPMLNHPDHTFRMELMETLKAIGPAAVPKLREALNSVIPRIQSHSLSVLNHLTLVESDVLERLEDAPDIQIRVCVAQAWTRHGKHGVTKLGALCQSDDLPVAVAAIESLKHNYSDPEVAISSLRRCLRNKETWTASVAALQTFGVDAQVAVPDILSTLPSTTSYDIPIDTYEELLSEAIDHIGPASIDDLSQLGAMLSHPNLMVRVTAADLIGRLGPAAKSATADLVTAFEASQREQRHLKDTKPLTTEEGQSYVSYQADLHFAVQCKMAEAFWMVSRDTRSYSEMLETVFHEPDLYFCYPQTQVIHFTRSDVEILQQLLDRDNSVIRSNMAQSFRSIPSSLLSLKALQRLRDLNQQRSTFYSNACCQFDKATENQIIAWLREDFETQSISLQDAISFLRSSKIRAPYFDALIRDQLNSRNLGQRTNALIYSVIFAETDKEASELVLDTVRKDWDMRPTALRLLLHRTHPSPGVIEFAERSLNSTSHGVVSNSLALLIKTASANPSLISDLEARVEKFRKSKHPWRGDLALYALAFLKKDKSANATGSSPLLALDKATRSAIFSLISRLNDDSDFFLADIRSYLEEASTLKSGRTERMREALRLLGSLPSKRAKELLRQYSLDRDWQIRNQATNIIKDLDAGVVLPYEHDLY